MSRTPSKKLGTHPFGCEEKKMAKKKNILVFGHELTEIEMDMLSDSEQLAEVVGRGTSLEPTTIGFYNMNAGSDDVDDAYLEIIETNEDIAKALTKADVVYVGQETPHWLMEFIIDSGYLNRGVLLRPVVVDSWYDGPVRYPDMIERVTGYAVKTTTVTAPADEYLSR